jgi:hypothetical protein
VHIRDGVLQVENVTEKRSQDRLEGLSDS